MEPGRGCLIVWNCSVKVDVIWLVWGSALSLGPLWEHRHTEPSSRLSTGGFPDIFQLPDNVIYHIYTCVLCTCVPGTHGGQKRAVGHLELLIQL